MRNLDLKRAALIILDLQKGLLGQPFAPHSAAEVVGRAAALAQAVRSGGGTVILVNVGFAPDFADAPKRPVDLPLTGSAPGSDWYDFPEELGQSANDIVITKRQWGAFYGTELDLQLRRRGVETVIVCGYATNIAVESTARGVWERGYNVIFAEDACASFSAEMHDFTFGSTFPLIGHVRFSESIIRESTAQSPGATVLPSYICFAGRNAVVTGGCGTIGEAVVMELARLGANVAIADIDFERAKKLADQVSDVYGVKAIAIGTDTSNPDECKSMITQTLKAFGSLHLAANTATLAVGSAETAEQTADTWQIFTGTELDGVFYAMKHQTAAIVRSGGGAIVNIGSVFGRLGQAGNAVHAAAKHGLTGLTRSAALEYARQGVRVNMVSPGDVMPGDAPKSFAPLNDGKAWLGRPAYAAEVAAIVIFALSDSASYLVGAELLADGGLSLE